MPDTRQRDGYIGIETFANMDADGIVLIEKWQSRAHYQAYFNWRMERGDIARIASLCSGQPSIRYYEMVDV
jgi:quinol monooxygenase YgiN